MLVKILKSKIHCATITDTRLHYPGSIAIDSKLMEAAGILPYECVLVADLNNGHRFETYVVKQEPDSRKIIVLGAAAQLVEPGDRLIIFGFAYCTSDEAQKIKPKVIVLDENNKIKSSK